MIERPTFAAWLAGANDVTGRFLAMGADPANVNLAGGLPDPALFPAEAIAAAARRALEADPKTALSYAPVAGLDALREALAARMRAMGATAVTAENVILTGGSAQALDLLGKALVDPGDVIAAQAPTYLGALDAWRPRAPAYRPLDLPGGEAADPEALRGAKFVYTVPNFSNPTGALVGETERARILAAARAAGTWLVEDDPYGALFLDGPPLRTMLAMDAAVGPGPYDGPVVYLGSFSKDLVPGLRVGWAVAAPALRAALTTAKQGADLSSSALTQAIALGVLEDGIIPRHLPGLLAEYRKRRDALCAAAEAHLSEWFRWERPSGGMFLWLEARDPAIDTDAVFARAAEAGVLVSPSRVFDPLGRDRTGLRLNFTLNDPERLALGVERLAAATRDWLGGNG